MGLTVAALGLWYAFSRGHRRQGGVIAALGAGWSVFAVLVIVPAFLGGSSIYYSQYESVGGSPSGIVRTALTQPWDLAAALTRQDDLVFLVLIGLPLLGLFLLSPALAAVAVPQLLINGLSDRPTMTDPRFHYVAGAIPFLFAALIVGLRRLPPVWRVRAAMLVLAACALSSALVGPLVNNGASRELHGRFSDAHVAALRAAVALVPDGAPVTVTNSIGGHLSARRYVYGAPVVGTAEWAVLDMRNSWMPRGPRGGDAYPGRLEAMRRRLERSVGWEKVFERNHVVVFRRVGR
jgi:hypothetical protein